MKMSFISIVLLFLNAFSQGQSFGVSDTSSQTTNEDSSMNKMKIEIWSDVFCPYCYIGKRNLEMALDSFPGKDNVEIIWHSYQLQPEARFTPGLTANEALAKKFGTDEAQVKKMQANVTSMAAKSGIEFHTEKMVWANSFDAHRLIQYSKTVGKSHELEELLFKAVFTDGQNIEDKNVLIEIAVEAGLDRDEVTKVMNSDQYKSEVNEDINQAHGFGLRGVPTFIVDRKSMFSGALPVSDFTRVLNQLYNDWLQENPVRLKGMD